METESEIDPATLPDPAPEARGTLIQASAKLQAIIRQHAEACRKGSGVVSPYPEMAARIQERAERGNGLRGDLA